MVDVSPQTLFINGVDMLGDGHRLMTFVTWDIDYHVSRHCSFLIAGGQNDPDHCAAMIVFYIVLNNDHRVCSECF